MDTKFFRYYVNGSTGPSKKFQQFQKFLGSTGPSKKFQQFQKFLEIFSWWVE